MAKAFCKEKASDASLAGMVVAAIDVAAEGENKDRVPCKPAGAETLCAWEARQKALDLL